MKSWKELSIPFETEKQTQFFVEKLHKSLHGAQKLKKQAMNNAKKNEKTSG
ncbi:hypothetical protein [Candidatus Protochlamydia sp. W-9]|uniref:hypothetical protein n=1 Tax=Candidatus Protochlamydia sp. W-9 TaxID=1785087 RepID=UPI000B027C22|nr:hypothetical protein [Candidatus Protochlamydia sp. W-9]